ncbi:MAG: hypothetical protein ACRC6O_13430 [Flavobacterium sp.]
MKEFRISLAVKQPMNYKIYIKANSEQEAKMKAIEAFRDNSIDGDFEDCGGSSEEAFNEDTLEGIAIINN